MNETHQKILRKVSPQTFELAYIFTDLSDASTRAEVLMKEPTVGNRARDMLRTVKNTCDARIRDLTAMLDAPSRELLRTEVVGTEAALQVKSIMDMTMSLPIGIRSQVEQYVEQLYNVYKQK